MAPIDGGGWTTVDVIPMVSESRRKPSASKPRTSMRFAPGRSGMPLRVQAVRSLKFDGTVPRFPSSVRTRSVRASTGAVPDRSIEI